jgi:hypothetical protein
MWCGLNCPQKFQSGMAFSGILNFSFNYEWSLIFSNDHDFEDCCMHASCLYFNRCLEEMVKTSYRGELKCFSGSLSLSHKWKCMQFLRMVRWCYSVGISAGKRPFWKIAPMSNSFFTSFYIFLRYLYLAHIIIIVCLTCSTFSKEFGEQHIWNVN